MYKTSDENSESSCLACGKEIYGRPDKKFCCDKCRNAYHNRFNSIRRKEKEGVINSIYRNYSILERLLKSGMDSAELCDLENLGFRPAILTSFHQQRNHNLACRCFDICYRQNGTKITKIRRSGLYSTLFGESAKLIQGDDGDD